MDCQGWGLLVALSGLLWLRHAVLLLGLRGVIMAAGRQGAS